MDFPRAVLRSHPAQHPVQNPPLSNPVVDLRCRSQPMQGRGASVSLRWWARCSVHTFQRFCWKPRVARAVALPKRPLAASCQMLANDRALTVRFHHALVQWGSPHDTPGTPRLSTDNLLLEPVPGSALWYVLAPWEGVVPVNSRARARAKTKKGDG